MRQHFVALITLLALVSAAAAQSNPTPSSTPTQQPGSDPTTPAAQMAGLSPNAIPAVPPAFVPGLANTETETAPPRLIRISGGVMAANVVTKVDPAYPEAARADHLSGAVVMSARIGKDGRVENLAVVSGPAVFQAPAVNAVKQWTYRPYLLHGKPVEVQTVVTLQFDPH